MAADKLQRIFEYRVLLARKEDLSITLDPEQREHLTRLQEQLRTGVPQLDARDVYTLVTDAWPVQMALAGRFVNGTVRNASGGGFAIEAADPPALGDTVVLQIASEQQGVEYTFPGRVIWRVLRGTPSVGVAFAGIATKTAISRFSGVYEKNEVPVAVQEATAKRHAG